MSDLPGIPAAPPPPPDQPPPGMPGTTGMPDTTGMAGARGLASADPRIQKAIELAGRLLPRLQAYAASVRVAVKVLAFLIVGTAIVAIAIGAGAFRDQPIGILIVVVVCLPAIIGAVRLTRRLGALADSVANADQWKAELQGMGAGVADSDELRDLQAFLQREEGVEGRGVRQLLRYRKLTGLASGLVERAKPSEEAQPNIFQLHPEQLAKTWGSFSMAIWGWGLAGLSIVVGLGALAASLA